MKAPVKLVIDSRKGGNGDIWMRLISLYSTAALLPEFAISVYIPKFMFALATHSLPDRIEIATDIPPKQALTYTSLGIRHLIQPILKGGRFIAPYARSVIHDKKQTNIKDHINKLLYAITDITGFIQVPADEWINCYQGYLDIIGIKKFRKISYASFITQFKNDYAAIFERLSNNIPTSAELVIPDDLSNSIVIYPSGTSRQFIPVWWAKENMADAYYAFFFKDKDALAFLEAGLKVIYFYNEPGDIIVLAKHAYWVISTDSFPSHLLQSSVSNSTITITELLKSRVISPAYEGKVTDAVAECHPCLHLDRSDHPVCEAGYKECINWKSTVYTNRVKNNTDITHKIKALH